MKEETAFHDEIMTEIKGLGKRLDTLNGSVLSLKLWRAYLTGAVAVIIMIVLPIIAYLGLQVIAQGTEIATVMAQVKK